MEYCFVCTFLRISVHIIAQLRAKFKKMKEEAELQSKFIFLKIVWHIKILVNVREF